MSDGPAIPTFGARRAQPLDDMLARAGDMSLDQLTGQVDKAMDVARATQADRDQVAALAARLLEPGFLPLLEWLCDISLRRPVFLPLGLGAEAVAIYCAGREGENRIVWQLLRAAAQGRSQQIEPREGD